VPITVFPEMVKVFADMRCHSSKQIGFCPDLRASLPRQHRLAGCPRWAPADELTVFDLATPERPVKFRTNIP